jgi:Tol biopolymer transport system component
MRIRTMGVTLTTALLLALSGVALAAAFPTGPWSDAIRVEDIPGTDPSFNTPSLDGCPFISRDGKTFYMASDRSGGLGGIDIWVSTRASTADSWGPPVNVGEPVNSSSNDFCPTIDRDGHRFFFVSNRPGGCGGDDIYVTRLHADSGFDPVTNVGCDANGGANSAANEASPFPLPETGAGPVLYFSSTRSGAGDIYRARKEGARFGLAEPVDGVNTEAVEGQPNVRRDGLEIFFFSTRSGGQGAQDIYSATRASTDDPWSTPVNLGSNVNSPAGETRPSLSWDGTALYFGSTRTGGTAEGSSDIYVTTRG